MIKRRDFDSLSIVLIQVLDNALVNIQPEYHAFLTPLPQKGLAEKRLLLPVLLVKLLDNRLQKTHNRSSDAFQVEFILKRSSEKH